MSKVFVTKKAVNETFGAGYVYQVGYCNVQHLLRTLEAFGYHTGYYGWNCDMYELRTSTGIRICVETGYRPSGIKVPYDIVSKYEKEATEAMAYSNYAERLDKLQRAFADELIKL